MTATLDSPTTTPARTGFDLLRGPMQTLPKQNIADLAKLGFGRSDIIPLWFGEGDLTTPEFIGTAAHRAVQAGETFYTHQSGIPALREALATYMSGLYAQPVAPERVTVTSGGMPAIQLACQAVLDPGDVCLVIEPVWPNVMGAIRILSAEKRPVAMDLTPNGWQLDLERVAAAVDDRTRAIFLASPGNPTGWVMPSEQQAALLDFARERGLWIIADEVYTRLTYDERPAAPSFLDHAGPEDPVLVVNSFSKSWCMTGWRMGWLTAPASLEGTLAQLIQYNTSGTATFLQHAAVAAITEGEPFVQHVRARCRTGRDIVCRALDGFSKTRLAAWPQGGMYAYFQVEGMTDSIEVTRQVFEATAVGLAPGFAFGAEQEGFLRLCFCTFSEVLVEAMGRLETVFG